MPVHALGDQEQHAFFAVLGSALAVTGMVDKYCIRRLMNVADTRSPTPATQQHTR